MELELSEDDQMMRAIAMSLGDNIIVSTDQVHFHHISTEIFTSVVVRFIFYILPFDEFFC